MYSCGSEFKFKFNDENAGAISDISATVQQDNFVYNDELTMITRIVNLDIFVSSWTWISKDCAIYRNIALRPSLTPIN